MDADRLLRAALFALGKRAEFNNMRAVSISSSHRGSSLEFVNRAATIRLTADWLEGELAVAIVPVDGPPIAFDDLANSADATGLSLTRLPKGISRDSLARRIVQILELVDAAVPGILDGSHTPGDEFRRKPA